MITDQSIVEVKANRLNVGSGTGALCSSKESYCAHFFHQTIEPTRSSFPPSQHTVTFAIKIEEMAKLKFRREESLSLFFKPAANDPLVYMCLDSALAVQDIQNVLKRHGVKGKHTNAATQRAIQMALNLVALLQQKEKELISNPSVDRVNEIMDLYRQAAEKFEVAGDPRHAEVLAHMKRFLNQEFTTSILDGTFVNNRQVNIHKGYSPRDEKAPQGEVLDQPTYNLSNDDDDDDVKEKTDGLNDSSLQNVEDMLNEAVKDLSDIGMDDDEINEILTSPTNRGTGKEKDDLADHDDAYAELDAMLSDADKELNELLNS